MDFHYWLICNKTSHSPAWIYILSNWPWIKGSACFRSILDRSKVFLFSSIYMFAQSYPENMTRWRRRNTGSTWLTESIAGLSINGAWSHSHAPTHTSIYLGMLSLRVQKFIWPVNSMLTLQQVCSVIPLLIIHLQCHINFGFHL